MLYPFTFKPILKKVIWGGSDICPFKGITPVENGVGESWELSHVEGNYSIVDNGELEGKSLDELIRSYGKELLGEKVMERFGTTFPLLIKFIDARDNLSIQVHPDDELAKKRHNSFGKTEMWYVVDCRPESTLFLGFSRAVTPDELRRRAKDGTICEVLNRVAVHPGDVFFVRPGTVHAIGAGILVAEIQQNSDTTFRVYDYNRLGADGKPRQLHLERAAEVMNYAPMHRAADTLPPCPPNGVQEVLTCEYFRVRRAEVKTRISLATDGESFTHLMCVRGEGNILCGGKVYPFRQGDSYFLPAALGEYMVQGTCGVILSGV